MIKNEREYKIVKAKFAKLTQQRDRYYAEQAALPDVDTRLSVFPFLKEAWLTYAQAELDAYEALASSSNVATTIALNSLESLPVALIGARIASGLTQKQLGDRLGLKEQQIQQYEQSDYQSASLRRLIEIADALGVRASGTILVLPDSA